LEPKHKLDAPIGYFAPTQLKFGKLGET